MWVVVRPNHLGLRLYGPFRRRALASGYGFQRFGSISAGNLWQIQRLRGPR